MQFHVGFLVVSEALLQARTPGFDLHGGAVAEEGAHAGGGGGEVGWGGLGLRDVAGCWAGVDVGGDAVVGGAVWGGREIVGGRVCDVGDWDGGEWDWV